MNLLNLCVAAALSVFPSPHPLKLGNALQDKNFYFLSLIEHDQRVAALIESDPVLARVSKEHRAALHSAFEALDIGKIEPLSSLRFSNGERDECANALQNLFDRSPAIRSFAGGELRSCGCYEHDAALSDRDLIAKAWRECADGIDSIIDVYGTQTKVSRSPWIDAPLFTTKSEDYGTLPKTLAGALDEDSRSMHLFFEPSMRLALGLLTAQLRDEAARYEPMQRLENRAAFLHATHIDWSRYKYSAILVPGLGPDEPGVRLSPVSRLVLGVAAKRYRSGLAPFIIVSGGHVHPSMTPYCEAVEMKKSLIADYRVPEEAIVIEPHARHTTTNFRNSVRLMYRYGFPLDKLGLVIANPSQCGYIAGQPFAARCQDIFGYQPATRFTWVGPFDISFLPNVVSLSIDPLDPLDP